MSRDKSGKSLIMSVSCPGNQVCCSCGLRAQHEFIANFDPKIVLFACGVCFDRLMRSKKLHFSPETLAQINQAIGAISKEIKNCVNKQT